MEGFSQCYLYIWLYWSIDRFLCRCGIRLHAFSPVWPPGPKDTLHVWQVDELQSEIQSLRLELQCGLRKSSRLVINTFCTFSWVLIPLNFFLYHFRYYLNDLTYEKEPEQEEEEEYYYYDDEEEGERDFWLPDFSIPDNQKNNQDWLTPGFIKSIAIMVFYLFSHL